MKYLLAILFIVFSLGCTKKSIQKTDITNQIKTNVWANVPDEANTEEFPTWWKSFKSEELNQLVAKSLNQNWDLRTAWANLKKMEAINMSNYSLNKPAVGLDGQAKRTFTDNDINSSSVNLFSLAPSVGWEIDLWGKLKNTQRASVLDVSASRFEIESTALLVTSSVTSTWLNIKYLESLVDLLDQQIATSRTLLDLVETKFSQGLGNALQVLQQRQQMIAVEARKPATIRDLESYKNKLSVLLGKSPGTIDLYPSRMPELPLFPKMIDAKTLFARRPDLQALTTKIKAQDHRVQAALLSKLPNLKINLSWAFSATSLNDIFESTIGTILGSSSYSIFDNKKQEALVLQNKSQLEELLSILGSKYLDILTEIQNGITNEKYYREESLQVDEQIHLAKLNLNEAKNRYLNGLIEYAEVITAIQTLQSLERTMINIKNLTLINRVELYKSLGGHWEDLIKEPKPLVKIKQTMRSY